LEQYDDETYSLTDADEAASAEEWEFVNEADDDDPF
jgi:hypothetical protein